jgi:hypothetical protein
MVLLCLNFYGQESKEKITVEIKKSEKFKARKRSSKLTFSVEDGKGGVVTFSKYMGGYGGLYAKGYFIRHFDENLKLVGEHEFEEPNKNADLNSVFIHNGNLYMFETAKKDGNFEFNVYSTTIGSFNFSKKNLTKVLKKDVRAWDSNRYGGAIEPFLYDQVVVSENEKYFCFGIAVKDKQKREKKKYFLYDMNFNKVFEKTFIREVNRRKFQFTGNQIDEYNEAIVVLGQAYTEEKKKKKNKEGAKYQFELYQLNSDGQRKIIIDPQENYIPDLFPLFKSGKVYCVGFYSLIKDTRYKGVSYFEIDETFQLKKEKYTPFTEQFLNDKYGDRKKRKKKKELKNISPKSLIMGDDGNILLNAEEFYITSNSYSGTNGTMNTTFTYHFDDIMSIKFDQNGDVVWARNINKRQASAGGFFEYLSFEALLKNNTAYLFINAGAKSIKQEGKKKLNFVSTRVKKMDLFLVTINSDGEYTYQQLTNYKSGNLPIHVSRGIDVNENEIIFLSGKKKEKQFVKVILKD